MTINKKLSLFIFYKSLTMLNNPLPFTTGDTIRRLRILKGFKQIEAGKKLGIGQQAYSKME